MTSTRFPGKILADLCGTPVLQHVVERVQKAKLVDAIVVAIDPVPADNTVMSWGIRVGLGVRFFSLPPAQYVPKDLLTLFYECAQINRADLIVRVTADCPLIDPTLIDAAVAVQQATAAAYVDTLLHFPEGTDVEVFTYHALVQAHKNATTPYEREHVTPYIRECETYRLHLMPDLNCRAGTHFSIDTPEDLDRLRALYPTLPENFGWRDLLS